MKTMRIGFICSAGEMTGTYFRAFLLGKYLVEEGHEVSLVASSRKATLHLVKKLVEGVNVSLLPSLITWGSEANPLHKLMLTTTTSFMHTLLNCIFEVTSDFDVLHLFDVAAPQNATPMLFSKISRLLQVHDKKIFVDWHEWWGRGGLFTLYGGAYSLAGPLLEFLEEKVPLYVDAVTVHNETMRRRALSVGVQPEDLFVIPNGANTDFIKPLNLYNAREKLNLPMKKMIYAHFGSLNREIFKLLMQAHRKVVKRCPNSLLLLVGRLKEDQAEFVKSHNGNVVYVGRQPYNELPLYLGASDVLLLPMRDTPFDRARPPAIRLGDYLAAGRPVIATALPENEKVVRKCGFLAKPGDPEDFANKILETLRNPDLCREMGGRARELAEREYSWQILAKQLEKLYNRYV